MTTTQDAPLKSPDKFFIDGQWVEPSTSASFDVINPSTEEVYYRVAEAMASDVDRAISAARTAFDSSPWSRLSHSERAKYLVGFADAIDRRAEELSSVWVRQVGVTHSIASIMTPGVAASFRRYARMAETFAFETEVEPSAGGEYAVVVREPVGVVGAIVAWNSPLDLIAHKVGPALLTGCTVILKAAPEAPGEAYLMAEIAEEIGLPAGVLNVITADREASERLVRDPRVDKIAFTGSTAAGRRIASILGERIGRYTLELGGKSAAVILDDADVAEAAQALAGAASLISGQVCSALTRIVVPRKRHNDMVEALAGAFSQMNVGDPFDVNVQMGPLAMERQRDKVEGLIAKGVADGAVLATGGGRPKHLEHGWFIEPTVFGGVDNSSTIAQEEIFGPVLSVIPADDEEHAIELANDTIYGLNASVFTPDIDRAREVAGRLRSGTVGHNNFRTDLAVGFGGFKQSGIGREGGPDALLPYLESKSVILEGRPTGSSN